MKKSTVVHQYAEVIGPSVSEGSSLIAMKVRQRVPELDILRFIAASAVVVYHLTYRVPSGNALSGSFFQPLPMVSRFGYLGVNLFFMISGFVILWSALDRTPTEFVLSRFTRLFPSFWVSVALTSLALLATNAQDGVTLVRFVGNLTMVPGALRIPYIDGVYWTLFVELKFYLLIWFLIVSRLIHRSSVWLPVWLIILVASAFQVTPHWLMSLSLFPYGAYFAAGCYFYLMRASGSNASRLLGIVVAAALCLEHSLRQQQEFMNEVNRASGVVVMGCVASFFALLGVISLRPLLSGGTNTAVIMGAMTYPLYLLHNRIGKIIFQFVGPADHGEWFSLALAFGFVYALSYAVSLVTERRVCGALHRRLSAMVLPARTPNALYRTGQSSDPAAPP